jgi:hypothetical protein
MLGSRYQSSNILISTMAIVAVVITGRKENTFYLTDAVQYAGT